LSELLTQLMRVKASSLHVRRSYFAPKGPAEEGSLVEAPGTAPGSEPLITRAFITIVPKNETNIIPLDRR